MNLEKYKSLTGNDVPASQEAKYNAIIRRTKAKLEAMLGFSLSPKNLYTEKGKVQFEGYLPMLRTLDENTLLEPDDEEGTIKLFPYNETDRYFHVDPFRNIYSVKLVMPINDGEFITITELDNVVAKYGRDNIGRYIERHYEWFTWEWYRTYLYSYISNGDAGLMLAIDADWLDCYPDDILYLWCDMIDYNANPNMTLASESVDGHSWSRTKEDQMPPQDKLVNKQLLAQYAGPFGSVTRNPVR